MPGTRTVQSFALAKYRAAVERTLRRLEKDDFASRFLAKDPTLWKDDAKHAAVVRNRLGWVEVAGRMLERFDEIRRFADDVTRDGIRHV